jgi:plasmid stabilization system protein ParE
VTRRVAVRPQARIELIEAAEWYDERRSGVGARLVTAFEQTLERIARSPKGYQVAFGDLRRAPLRKLPYGVIYRVTENEIIVVGFIHHRRNPTTWQGRA